MADDHGAPDPVEKSMGSPLEEAVIARQEELCAACLSGDLDKVESLLESHGDALDINYMDEKKHMSALMNAAGKGHEPIVERLLRHPKIDVNLQNPDGYTALTRAAHCKWPMTARQLLQVPGIKVNSRIHKYQSSAFTEAVARGGLQVFLELLQHPDTDINMRTTADMSPIMQASMQGKTEMVRELLKRPEVDINFQRRDGNSALILAAHNGHSDVVRELLAHDGTNPCVIDQNGDTALSRAARNGRHEVIDEFRIFNERIRGDSDDGGGGCGIGDDVDKSNNRAPIDVNALNKSGESALMIASLKPRMLCAKALLKFAEIDMFQQNPVEVSKAEHELEEYSFDVDTYAPKQRVLATIEEGFTALSLAARKHHYDLCEVFINYIVDHHLNDEKKIEASAPLVAASLLRRIAHGAIRKRQLALIENTVKLGLKLSPWPLEDLILPKEYQDPPLVAAARFGRNNVVQKLIDLKADINEVDKNGASPMLVAALSNRPGSALLLLQEGGDVTLENSDGVTMAEATAILGPRGDELMTALRRRFAVREPRFVQHASLSDIECLASGNFGVTYRAELQIREAGYVVSMDETLMGKLSRRIGKRSVAKPIYVPVVCKCPKFGSTQSEWFELEVLQNVSSSHHVLGLLGMCMAFRNADTGRNSVSMIVPYLAGGSLDTFLRAFAPLSPTTVCSFAKDMASGVAHLHSNGYKHNDIACRNFLLREPFDKRTGRSDYAQQVVLADFGLSRPLSHNFELGTPIPWRWCAPETLRSGGRHTSEASDVWSLGVTIWELLSNGRVLPFHFCSGPRELLQHFHKSAEDGSTSASLPILRPQQQAVDSEADDTNEALSRITDIMRRCLALKPEERPAPSTVVEFLADFDSKALHRKSSSQNDTEEIKTNPLGAEETDAKPSVSDGDNVDATSYSDTSQPTSEYYGSSVYEEIERESRAERVEGARDKTYYAACDPLSEYEPIESDNVTDDTTFDSSDYDSVDAKLSSTGQIVLSSKHALSKGTSSPTGGDQGKVTRSLEDLTRRFLDVLTASNGDARPLNAKAAADMLDAPSTQVEDVVQVLKGADLIEVSDGGTIMYKSKRH